MLAYVDDRPASGCWVYFSGAQSICQPVGRFDDQEFRRQGLYGASCGCGRRKAAAPGPLAHRRCQPMSRPILEQAGFELLGWSYPCKWKHKVAKIKGGPMQARKTQPDHANMGGSMKILETNRLILRRLV